jgi:hypothetical protein
MPVEEEKAEGPEAPKREHRPEQNAAIAAQDQSKRSRTNSARDFVR